MKNRVFGLIVFLLAMLLAQMTHAQGVRLQTGDLLFVGSVQAGDSTMSGAITAATGRADELTYTHVAILEIDENQCVWVIEATPKRGVCRYPIDTFLMDNMLPDGRYPQMDVMRLRHAANVCQYVENAKKYCGEEYDLYFLPDNQAHYCSELVYDAYTTRGGRHLFHAEPMNFKGEDGRYPAYWITLFERIHQPIPQGVPGTNPQDMSQERRLKRVGAFVPIN